MRPYRFLLCALVLVLSAVSGESLAADKPKANLHSPEVTIIAPTAGSTVGYNTEVTLKAKVFDPEDFDDCCEVEWQVNGVTIGSGGTIFTTFSSPGIRTITCKATDSGGRTGSATRQLNVVNQKPVPKIQRPNFFNKTAFVNVPFVVRGYATDPNETAGLHSQLLCENLAWTSTAPTDSFPFSDCAKAVKFKSKGLHKLTLTAEDAQGLSATDSATIQVDIPPPGPPVVVITGPLDGVLALANEKILLEGFVFDPEGTKVGLEWTVQFKDKKGNWVPSLPTSIGHTLSLSWTPANVFSKTEARICFSAKDSDGMSGSACVVISVVQPS